MSELHNLHAALSEANRYLVSLEAEKISDQELKKAASAINKSNKILSKLRDQPTPEYDSKVINKIIKEIASIKEAGPFLEKIPTGQPKTRLDKALDELHAHLKKFAPVKNKNQAKALKLSKNTNKAKDTELRKKIKSKSDIFQAKRQLKLNPPVKIRGINKRGATQPDKDLTKHLSIADKKLVQIKRQVEKASRPISENEFRKGTETLKRTDLALLKKMAFHKTVAPQFISQPHHKVMAKILQDITFIQNRLDLQVMTGTLQVQANTFRNALDEFKTRLRALKKLRRGLRVDPVENEPDPKREK